VDTYIGRRNTAKYHVLRQGGVELLVAPALTSHARRLALGVKPFLFWRRLAAQVELLPGMPDFG
jgi:hypothetical protein